jgi:hypothetical protein
MPKDDTIRRWWPTTQSLDLVEGQVHVVAKAVQAEFSRFLEGEHIEAGWRQFEHLDDAFRSVPLFDNVPTAILAIPTRSKWTVLWNNSFLCNGYDSLCSCLTTNHGLTTIHWSAHDDWTTFQSGASFNHRRLSGGTMEKRSVACVQQDKRWIFNATGRPLPEESVEEYGAKRKRDRLNERNLLALLERLEARPWSIDFYALPEQECFLLRRPSSPQTVQSRTVKEVLRLPFER